MSDEHEPLSPDEYVLRRVSAYQVDTSLPIPIAPQKFEPIKDDDDGISMFRVSHKTPQQLLENAKGKHGYYVLRFQVKELIAMGLTPTPTGDPLGGHVSIPELSLGAVRDDPDTAETLMTNLAAMAWTRVVLAAPK